MRLQHVTASETAINSFHYGQIIRAKDLVADVLPPPAYLLESYLEANLAVRESADLDTHVAALAKLKKDYNDRHAFWTDEATGRATMGSMRRSTIWFPGHHTPKPSNSGTRSTDS